MTKLFSSVANQERFPFALPRLPYAKDALAPHMSEESFSYHHEKHHNAYVVNLNKLVEGTDLNSKSLEELILLSAQDSSKSGIFNNAAQVWNHTFFWHSMKQNGGGKPGGKLLAQIEENFGSFEDFIEQFKQAGATQFGSGWAWLVDNNGTLEIVKTANAETPITDGKKPLLTCDVWEHAYYIDHRNARPAYLNCFIEHLANWEFAEKNFEG